MELQKQYFEKQNNKKYRINQTHRKRDLEQRRRRYEELVREVESAIKSGDLSKTDAQRKLDLLDRKMSQSAKESIAWDQPSRERKARMNEKQYNKVYKEIEAAVKAGKMSKQDARKKLIIFEIKLSSI